jgi:ribonuclease P protein component
MAPVERLLKRADFLKCAQGRRWNTAAFAVQMQSNGLDGCARIGFTVSRKNGNAVIRNRIRRRLKAAAACVQTECCVAGHDYVIVARPEALNSRFEVLKTDIGNALAGVYRKGRPDRTPQKTVEAASPSSLDGASAKADFTTP